MSSSPHALRLYAAKVVVDEDLADKDNRAGGTYIRQGNNMLIESVRALHDGFVVTPRRVGKLRKSRRDFRIGGSFKLGIAYLSSMSLPDSDPCQGLRADIHPECRSSRISRRRYQIYID